MNIERMVLKLEHPNGSPLVIHEDIHISVEWVSKEFMSHYLSQLAIAVSHVCAPRYEVEVLLSGKC